MTDLASPPASRAALMSLSRMFLRDLMSYSGRKGIYAAMLVGVGALVEGVSLALIVPLVGIVTGTGMPFGRMERGAAGIFDLFGVTTPFGKLAMLMVLFGGLMILRGVIVARRDIVVAELQVGFVEAQRMRIAELLAAASWDQVVRLRHARVTHLMSGDIQRIGAAAGLLLRAVVSGVMLLAQAALVFVLAPALALWAFVLLAAVAALDAARVRRRMISAGSSTRGNLSLLDTTAQFLGGLKLAVSQNLQTRFIDEFRASLHEVTARQIDFIRQQTISRLIFSAVTTVGAGILVLIGFGLFEIAPATLIALLVVIARMSGPAMVIQIGLQQTAHTLPAYHTVKQLDAELSQMPRADDLASAAVAQESDWLDGAIAFEHVSFLHPADEDQGNTADAKRRGLRDVSLVIEPHSFVGIGGPSGAGKTTFADLLVGLYPPQEGRVMVGGAPLAGTRLAAWRAGVGYVSQDPYLFHDTVRHNLTWAAPAASDDELWGALAAVGVDALVRRMPKGLDTMVGERGTLVSGGERQRIALARAILRRPRLMVLDEATSAIDVAGERAIIEMLRSLPTRPTVVMIAHRAESLEHCDRVLRFENGRCVAL